MSEPNDVLRNVLNNVRVEDLYVGERIPLGDEYGSLLVTKMDESTVTFEHEVDNPFWRFYTVTRD